MNKIMLFVCICALFSSVAAVAASTCTATLDKGSCVNGETITVTFLCSAGNERNQPYNATWVNATNASAPIILETDNGTTHGSVNTPFFESFVCPAAGTMDGNVTLAGANLEGGDTFSLVAAGSSALIIVNISITSDILLGKTAGFEFILVDENGKRISRAACSADIEDGDGVPITAITADFSTKDGVGTFSGVANVESLSEGRQFALDIRCDCGRANTSASCVDEDGLEVELSSGSAEFPFSVGTWLSVNTVTDKREYVTGENLLICANVTNPEGRTRQHIIIDYNYRCDNGSDTGFQRVLIGTFREERGISGNLTQTQCHDFLIPDFHSIERGSTICYAGTRLGALDEANNFLVEYHTTSPDINITSSLVHPMMLHWTRVSRLSYQVNVSINEFDVGVRDVHVQLNPLLDKLDTPATSVKSFSVTFINGSPMPFATEFVTHDLTLMGEDTVHSVIVSIKDVNTTLGQEFRVIINFQGGDTMQIGAVALAILAFAFLYVAGYFHRANDMALRAGSIMVGVLLAANAALVSSVDIAEASPAVTLTIWVIRLALIVSFMWVLLRSINALTKKTSGELEKEY